MAAGGHLRVARDLVRGCVAGLCKVLLCCCYGGGCGVRHGDRAWTGPQRAALLDHVRLSPCTTHQHQQHLTARGSARTSLRRGARYYGAGVAAASASTAPGPAHPPRVLAPRSAPAASASSLSLCLAPRHTLSCASRVAKKLCQREIVDLWAGRHGMALCQSLLPPRQQNEDAQTVFSQLLAETKQWFTPL